MCNTNIGKIKNIFLTGWESYCKANTVRTTEYTNVLKSLSCRTELLGYHKYKCPKCEYEIIVPHSCKSRFCSVCGTIANEEWVKERSTFLLDCPYWHVVITVPFRFYWIIKRQRLRLLGAMVNIGCQVIQEWAKTRGYEVGIVAFYHSFGGNLQFHPHWHLIVTRGGITAEGNWKKENSKIPMDILMPRFKAKFCNEIKEALRSGKIELKTHLNRYLHGVNEVYKEHWQMYCEAITTDSRQTMRYMMRYVKRMILSEKRIIGFNDKEVWFYNKEKKLLVYKIDQFIKCVVQHIPEHQFKQIRYYGFYASASKKKYAQAKKHWNTISIRNMKKSWRIRQWQKLGYDPLICKECNLELLLCQVRLPISKYKITIEKIKEAIGIAVQRPLLLDYG